MLEKLEKLPFDTVNVVVYTNSPFLQMVVKDMLKTRFGVDRYTTKYVKTAKELKDVKAETVVQPFGGGLWMVDVDTEKINIKEIGTYFDHSTSSSLTVYWVNQYSQYRKIIELDKVNQLGRYCFQAYLGRLEDIDIQFLHDKLLTKEEQKLSKQLLTYLKKNYTYDVTAVCSLFDKVRKGERVRTTKDIVDMVGIGGNTVDSFVMKLLTANPKTQKGIESTFKKDLKLLQDLSYTIKYKSIRNFMLYALDTIVDIKMLQVQGKFSRVRKELPDNYDEKRIGRLRRYEGKILESVTLPRVLNLRTCLLSFNDYDVQLSLVQAIMLYLTSLLDSNELNGVCAEAEKEKEEQKRRKAEKAAREG